MSKLRDMGTPIFWAEGHPGPLPAEGWEVSVGGLVERPTTLTYEEILALPKTIADARLTSVTRFSVRGRWGGVRLSDVFSELGVQPQASHVQFFSYRRIYTTSIPLAVALQERTLLAYEFDGEPLDADYGGPVRIFCPYLWGYKSAKSVVAITLEDHSIPGFWEVRGYPDAAEIKPGSVLDINTGRRRRIPGGEVVEFLD
jgi:DMSO/TMAO reductase YedYZ molybdopterin-dependent catalytic subunit